MYTSLERASQGRVGPSIPLESSRAQGFGQGMSYVRVRVQGLLLKH